MNNLIKQIIESKFNFNIDKDNERQNSLSTTKYNSISQKKLYLDQYVVDLGLPSKTIWCKYNLGVDINQLNTAENWYGNYYAWGELNPKDQYTCENYKFGYFSHIKKYYSKKDELKQLQLEDDAAYQNLHLDNYKFRIPSKEQFEELLENTTSEWVKNYNDINGLNGAIFKSKINNNELFIPTAGFYDNSKLFNIGIAATLWSSNLFADGPNNVWYFYFDPGWHGMNYGVRYSGMTIRPVLLKS